MTSSTITSARPGRFHWLGFRFTLRTFLIFCVLPVPILAWLANVKMSAVRQRAALARLQACGIEGQRFAPLLPTRVTLLMRKYVDQDAYMEVRNVTWCASGLSSSLKLDREDITALTRLQGLRDLDLVPQTISGGRRWNSPLSNSDGDFIQIAQIRELGSFAVNAPIDEKTQMGLAKLPKLHSLSLPGAQLTDSALERLGHSDVLTSLEFNAALTTPRGLICLQNAPRLQTLTVHHLQDASGFLKALIGCKALTHLTLQNSVLRVIDASTISRLPIQSLRLFNCELERGFFGELIQATGLKSLDVGTSKDGRRGFLTLSLANLKYCDDHFTAIHSISVRQRSNTNP